MSKRIKNKFWNLKKYNIWNKNSQDRLNSRMENTGEWENKLEGMWL